MIPSSYQRENSLLRSIRFAERRAEAEETPISKIKTGYFDSVLTCWRPRGHVVVQGQNCVLQVVIQLCRAEKINILKTFVLCVRAFVPTWRSDPGGPGVHVGGRCLCTR
ncbi:hypothetical protein E2C01_097903 [Portunus trituberculatus]|uniref:Uncharacterized protein n=1 Tax=Portunus trituberculatus TaxID=210409 RepID=A0A5B7K632_PORTR|nr:hypothetical protein [Portunus trituberculatus]